RRDLYDLICKPFMEEKLRRPSQYQSFYGDVELAIEVAGSEDPPNMVEIIKGCFIIGTVRSLVTNTSPEILGALAQLGGTQRAIDYADVMRNAAKRSRAYHLIAKTLERREEEGSSIYLGLLNKAIETAYSIEKYDDKALVLSEFAETL